AAGRGSRGPPLAHVRGDVLDLAAEHLGGLADEFRTAVGLADLDQVDVVHGVAKAVRELHDRHRPSLAKFTDLGPVRLECHALIRAEALEKLKHFSSRKAISA